MGQQQLLLVVLSVLVVALSFLVGMNMFASYDAQANQDALISDIYVIAARAQEWYRKPRTLGGGGRTFISMDLAAIKFAASNENGQFAITDQSPNDFKVTASGLVDPDGDGNPLQVSAVVAVDSVKSLAISGR